MYRVFHKEISRQDRLATTIANVVDPQHPRFFLPQAHFERNSPATRPLSYRQLKPIHGPAFLH
jgi:hypothetical protein